MSTYSPHFVITFFALAALQATAQTNTSPYSIVGIGDMANSNADRSAGMGSAGVSLSSGRAMYVSNPASLSALDEHQFSLELYTQFKGVSYYGNFVTLENSKSSDMQVTKFALGIKIKPFWGASVGVSPYSSSNYSFYSNKNIVGTTETTNAYYNGTGGLNRYYFSNGFTITKNLSLGAEVSYLAGSLFQNESMNTGLTSDSIVTTRDLYMNKLLVTAGLQYKLKLSKDLKLNIGATVTPKASLNADYTLSVREGSTALINDKTISETYFKLPVEYAAGASVVYKDKLTIAADYKAQQWSENNYKNLGYSLTNSNRISAGVQYAQLGKYYNYSYEKYYFQAGAYYSNTYLVVNGNQLRDYGFTAGAGANSKRSSLGYQLNLQIGSRGTISNGLLKENYTQIGLSIFYRDFWRTRAKRYD